MDGRLLQAVLVAGLAVGAAGCRTSKNEKLPDATLPKAGERIGLFGKSPQKFGPPKEEVVARAPRGKPGQPLKPETEAAFADAEVEAAYSEGKPAVERDALIDTARQRYQKALKQDPKNTAALAGLARLYSKIGDRERAAQIYSEALRQNPKNHELAFKMASMYAKAEEWPAACETCKVAIAIDPENRTYHKTFGYCAARAGQWDVAFDSLMRVMPEPEARYFLGRVLIDADRVSQGRQQLEMALRLDPKHEAAAELLADLDAPAPLLGAIPQPAPVQQVGGYER